MTISMTFLAARAGRASRRLGFAALIAAGAALVSQAPAIMAQDKPAAADQAQTPDSKTPESKAADPEALVATLDGQPITEADLEVARADFGAGLQRYPAESHREILLDLIVNLRLMAKAADAEGLDDSAEFKRNLDFARGRILRDMYFAEHVEKGISEADLRKAYETVAGGAQQEEVHARHILVKTEEEAKAIVAELGGGKDFEELAKEKSTGPSGAQGGDLGYFTKEQIPGPLADAAFSVEKGAVSAPVQTQFGWHVLKVEDKRMQQPPAFAEVEDQLRQMVMRDRFAAVLEGLKKNSKLDIVEQPKKAQ